MRCCILAANAAVLALALKNCSVDEQGRRMIWAPGCSGAGCSANAKDAECAWCVYDLRKCERVHGDACETIQVARDAEGLSCPVPMTASADNCFVPLDAPLVSAPFDDEAVGKMKSYFLRNFNINGSGGIVAARGAVPALYDCCPGGYTYHWMRDGALSMVAMQNLIDIDGVDDEAALGREILMAYVGWVKRMQQNVDYEKAHVEPKWNMNTFEPYTGGWCRPQTDGPPLRALALMHASRWTSGPTKEQLWPLIKFDLDWLARVNGTVDLETCDLWEETVDPNFLWNRATMRSALLAGSSFAQRLGDTVREAEYARAADDFADPVADHVDGGGFLTECPTSGGTDSCTEYAKSIDGAVLLSLIHVPWMSEDTAAISPSMTTVAKTVEAYNTVFCRIYEVNRADSAAEIPGVLIGRYETDEYGGGNPWVLLTASLASLLYQVAQVNRSLSAVELRSWSRALNSERFDGSPFAFVAAGDAVLSRLHAHVAADDFRLFEQIDRLTGKQYNAEDLTWSYAETLSALRERELAVDFMQRASFFV